MRGGKGGAADDTKAAVTDTFSLLRRYVLQETVGPLKGLGRTVAYGVAGALLTGIGSIILLLAVLRVLQTETGSAFAGNWSFAPFLLSALVALLLAAGAGFFGLKGFKAKPGREPEQGGSS
jgi:hypothetical protein